MYGSYKKANFDTKRLYLSLFWDGFWVKDKKIIKTKPTELLESILSDKTIFINSNTKLHTDAIAVKSMASDGFGVKEDVENNHVRITSNWLPLYDALRTLNWEQMIVEMNSLSLA
ncbi:MAG: hypothetical protein HY226_02905 [Candidatus Vogelbacteria bacterium]|nr:hypothetical protein [Candidatus Vogelbacteria bacterium]